ncbi:hypothetical protein NG752_00595 [Aliarcobacter cryaerophilus]|uniref:hypothetical protein n=1 Tax=Aliarcobacter cryaerophilus TaxID=28198 RepID=UPI003DA255EE
MKDLKISKELFNEITNSKCHEVFIKNEFIIAHSNLGMKMVNIYEFVFIKCKEWIIDKGYHISTSEDKINNYIYLYKMIKNHLGYEIDKSKGVQFDSKGYIDNLLEACEWILNEVNK